MAKILDMPKLSPTMEEGLLQTWHKKEGDAVNVDDLLAEVETDKALMEFRAFDKGTLLKILVAPGTNVKLGQAVAILGEAGEDVSALVEQAGGGGEAAPKAKTKAKAKADADAGGDEKADAEEEEEEGEEEGEGEAEEPHTDTQPEGVPAAGGKGEGEEKKTDKKKARSSTTTTETMQPPARAAAQAVRAKKPAEKGSLLSRTERDVAIEEEDAGGSGRVLASPYVRKVARERGIDLSTAHGSGEHGRIVPGDLEFMQAPGGEAKAEGGAPKAAPLARTQQPSTLAVPALAQPEVRPLSPMRKTIAKRLTQSKTTVPHFYLTIDVDAEPLSYMRESINAQLAEESAKSAKPGKNDEAPKPEKISLNDLLIKAVATALVRVPECNAQFTEDALLIHKRIDISVAVAIPDGLVTPVVRNADQKSVVAIAREVRDLAARARGKKLKLEEMSDGTFSISNLGMFGIDAFSAVINPPEGAILAVGQAREEPVVRDGAVVPGKKMSMTLSCDHRVIDGAVGASFLAELRALLEHPMRILTG